MDLYTLLCGPILRRIEPKKVCIWLATSIQPEAVNVSIIPLEKAENKISKKKEWQQSKEFLTLTKYNVHQLGGRLFVVLLEVTPIEGNSFLEETLYGYDISFQFKDSDKVVRNDKDSKSEKGGAKEFVFVDTYNSEKGYTYADLPYPVFVIPSQTQATSRILYGSCRKTQGHGNDALDAADLLVEEEWENYSKKQKKIPNFSLFHLGDQIYADDLHPKVFEAVRKLADVLMGYNETIPAYDNINEISLTDLKKFLTNYLNGAKGYDLEDLNLLTKVTYSSSDKRKNIKIFLVNYYSTKYGLSLPTIRRSTNLFVNGDIDVNKVVDYLSNFAGTSRSLIDLNEILPRNYLLDDVKSNYPKINTDVGSITYDGRREFLRKNSSNSTDDKGHLLSFGEFAALYLIHWGQFNILKNSYDPLEDSLTGYAFGTAYIDEYKQNLEGLISNNRRLKRLFANVPSYMIFDDHDVTDDWNLDGVWRQRTEQSVTGKRMVANALAAYWAFQAWGNDPDVFSDNKLITAVKDHLLNPLIAKSPEDAAKAQKFEEILWEFDDWAFTAPTNPIAVFLDNRTMRAEDDLSYAPELNHNKKFKAASLMSEKAYGKIEALIRKSNYRQGMPIIFCAPTPITGSNLFHEGQLQMINGDFNKEYTVVTKSKFKEPGRYIQDWEQWWSGPKGKYEFFLFIEKLMFSQVFILSGDVHYGFHLGATLYSTVTGKQYSIQQLTSSALKNNTLGDFDKINQLADFSFIDTKDDEYKVIDETYPFPGIPSSLGFHFKLSGKLINYSRLTDEDSWLIPHNNVGSAEFKAFRAVDMIFVFNQFLYSPSSLAPLVKSDPV